MFRKGCLETGNANAASVVILKLSGLVRTKHNPQRKQDTERVAVGITMRRIRLHDIRVFDALDTA